MLSSVVDVVVRGTIASMFTNTWPLHMYCENTETCIMRVAGRLAEATHWVLRGARVVGVRNSLWSERHVRIVAVVVRTAPVV